MFHEKGGFDVIIANPPYVGEKGHKELFEPIKRCSLKEFYQGKMDLLYFFFHLALNLLKDNGYCSFITTNYYITALGGKLLRKDFKNRAILKELINFNELKIFESALGQHNLITMLQKGTNKESKCRLVNVNRKGFLDNSFYNIVGGNDTETNYNLIKQENLYEGQENYIRLFKEDENSTLSIILNKIKTNNDVLGNICRVNNGVHTEADYLTAKKFPIRDDKEKNIGDGIYVLDKNNCSDLDTIGKINKNEKMYLKPFFKNSDIKKYYTNTINNKYLIYINKKEDDINK